MPERAAAEAVQGVVVPAAEQAAGVEPEEAELVPERAAAAVEPALVQLQDPVLARVRQLRSARARVHRLAPAQALPLVWVRREAPEWAPVPVRPSVRALEVRSAKGPVTDPATEPATKVPGLKTEPVLERLRSARQEKIKEQSGD